MVREFPINPALRSMAYNGQELTIVFNRKGRLEERHYAEVPREIAYGLYYKQAVPEILSYYARNIRKKFKLLKKI